MKFRNLLYILLIFIIIIPYLQITTAPEPSSTRTLADCPWPTFQGNPQRTGLSPFNTSSNPGKLTWRYLTNESITSSPVVGSNDTIYIGSSDNHFYAINKDGSLKWKYDFGSWVWESPAIGDDGTIYVSPVDENLYAIRNDGSLKWTFFSNGLGVKSTTPVISPDNTIYYSSWNILYAIDGDGNKKWHHSVTYGYPGNTITGSPALGHNGMIYFGCQNNYIYALNRGGTREWAFRISEEMFSSPTIGADGTIYVGSASTLYAINPNGTKKWIFETNETIYMSPAIDSNGTIYIGDTGNTLYAVDNNGTERWRFRTEGSIYSSPAIGADGSIYFGSYDWFVYSISSEGELIWKYRMNSGSKSSPAIGSDGTIYIGSWDDYLHAIGRPGKNPPSPPKTLEFNEMEDSVDLKWLTPDDDYGSSILEYNIYRGSCTWDAMLYQLLDAPSNFFRDENVVDGDTYFYYVTATNEYGESDPSNSISVTYGDSEDDNGTMLDNDMDSDGDLPESDIFTPGLNLPTILCSTGVFLFTFLGVYIFLMIKHRRLGKREAFVEEGIEREPEYESKVEFALFGAEDEK